MGIVISLERHRRDREPSGAATRRATVFFDLADPASYLAAERLERLPATLVWQPATLPGTLAPARQPLQRRAAQLRLPLVWPDRHPRPVPRAMRVAAYACAQERGAQFVLAASRLAFCGGFDLDDPEVLAEAAAAAGLRLEPAYAAAGDRALDEPIARAGRFLVAHGAPLLPAMQTGRLLFAGEARVGEAAAALRGAAARACRSG